VAFAAFYAGSFFVGLMNPLYVSCNSASSCSNQLVWVEGSAYAYNSSWGQAMAFVSNGNPCFYYGFSSNVDDIACTNAFALTVCQFDCAASTE
jgi:hypothetical protein